MHVPPLALVCAAAAWRQAIRRSGSFRRHARPTDGADPLAPLALAALSLNALARCGNLALPFALAGRDVLGAAKTGSGKSVAFLVPVVEALYRARWTRFDGAGALVLAPTRELAKQIFGELRKVAEHHTLTAALLTGGKDVAMERRVMAQTNIIIATPGRLLQHMDESPEFDTGGVKILVLDEADRCLDMGFSNALTAILQNLPKSRQTLLFSATQTKSVKSLARLSLHKPEYVAVHEGAAAPTPVSLRQAYSTCNLDQKLEVLLAFLRAHRQVKTIVFLTSCKQTQFVTDLLRRLRPGVSVACLHGRLKQPRRVAVVEKFQRSDAMVLLATDVAARGLDIPAVDWVLQLDCPEDVDQYIHRVGRAARAGRQGSALLLLTPREGQPFLGLLRARGVPIKGTKLNLAQLPGQAADDDDEEGGGKGGGKGGRKRRSATTKIAGVVASDTGLKEGAAKAYGSYLKAVTQMGDPAVFERDLTKYPLEEFAHSLGLPAVPRSRFLKAALRAREDEGGDEGESDEEGGGSALPRGAGRTFFDTADDDEDDEGEDDGGAAGGLDVGGEHEDGDAGGLLAVRQLDVQESELDKLAGPAPPPPPANRKRKRQRITTGGTIKSFGGTRMVFNDEGDALPALALLSATGLGEADAEVRAAKRKAEAADENAPRNLALLLGEEKEAEARKQMLAARGATGTSKHVTFDDDDNDDSEAEEAMDASGGEASDGEDSEDADAPRMGLAYEDDEDRAAWPLSPGAVGAVDAGRVSSYFERLRARVKAADRDDVGKHKARLREERLKRKNKLKALAGDEPAQAIAGEFEAGGGVTLGGASSDEDDYDAEEVDASSEDGNSSLDEGDSDGGEDQRFGARQRRAARVSASGGSLAEQEEAALRLLGAR